MFDDDYPLVGNNINDPDFRLQIYRDWRSVIKDTPSFGRERFCRNKGITTQNLEDIVREFNSYNPTGKRWK